MLALGLAVLLFGVWAVVGLALLRLLHPRGAGLENVLLAPVAGLAVTEMVLFWLNHAGLPVERVGPGVLVGLLAIAAVVLFRWRVEVPWRAYAPFVAVFLVGLFIVGWPALVYGFAWLSYVNDDMANYVLLAQQLLHHGFFDPPDMDALLQGRDYSQIGWFFHVVFNVRPGAQLVLAWVMSLTGLSGHQIFMPTMLALHLVLLSAGAALAYVIQRSWQIALLTGVLLALSPLVAQGTLNQLIGQVGGIALLAGCAATLLRPLCLPGWRLGVRYGVLVALLTAGLSTWYPEVLPFLGLAFGLYFCIGLLRREVAWRPLIVVLGSAAAAWVLFVNTYLVGLFQFLLIQAGTGPDSANNTAAILIFPTYLVPSGAAVLWGLQRLDALTGEPWLSASIVLGAALLVCGAVAAAVLAWRREPSAAVAAAMLLVGAVLAVERSAFGLYKLAMFVQPFILPALVIGWFYLARRRLVRVVPLLALAAVGWPAQSHYVSASAGEGSALQLPGGSQRAITAEFQRALAAGPPGPLILDTPNITLATLEAVYARGRAATFPNRDFLTAFFAPCGIDVASQFSLSASDSRLIGTICDKAVDASFKLWDPHDPAAVNPFKINTVGEQPNGDQACTTVITNTGLQSVVNRRSLRDDSASDFATFPCQPTNHLVFVNSQLGEYYFPSDQVHVGLFALEPEPPLWHGTSFEGIGRYLLFSVLQPSPRVRLMLNVTESLKGDAENVLPPASAIGDSRQAFPLLGRGSARVFSPPLAPQMVDGRPYLGIDMGAEGQRFPYQRSGLMQLYGADVPLDSRKMTAFARDISLVSEQEYAQMRPPTELTSFPDDLFQRDLEYSGIYEDGWVSEAAFVGLTQPEGSATLRVRGVLPALDDPSSSDLSVLVDGAEVGRQTISPGDFDVDVAVPDQPGRHQVELRFSHTQHLPAPDSRPVAALLRSVGFEASSP